LRSLSFIEDRLHAENASTVIRGSINHESGRLYGGGGQHEVAHAQHSVNHFRRRVEGGERFGVSESWFKGFGGISLKGKSGQKTGYFKLGKGASDTPTDSIRCIGCIFAIASVSGLG